MKKIFLLIMLSAATQQLFAQSLIFGIKAGLNESRADFGQSTSTTSDLAGFNAGVFADIRLNKFSVEPGLFYTTKGYHSHTSIDENLPEPYNFNAEGHVRLNYLEVPVNVLYHIKTGPLKIFLGAGPYAGIGLSGTSQGNSGANGTTTIGPTQKLEFGKNGEFNKTDLGLNALTGISLNNGLLFSVNYEFGIKNIDRGGYPVKNRVLNLSIGYQFL